VTITAATAMTIKRRVARVGEIPLFDFHIFFISTSPMLRNSEVTYLADMKPQYIFGFMMNSACDLENKGRR
jgi:hypothetical protein